MALVWLLVFTNLCLSLDPPPRENTHFRANLKGLHGTQWRGYVQDEEARLRAFVFKREGCSLICSHFWAPRPVKEAILRRVFAAPISVSHPTCVSFHPSPFIPPR